MILSIITSGVARLMKFPGHVPGGGSVEKIFTIDYQDGLFTLHIYQQGFTVQFLIIYTPTYSFLGKNGKSNQFIHITQHKQMGC